MSDGMSGLRTINNLVVENKISGMAGVEIVAVGKGEITTALV